MTHLLKNAFKPENFRENGHRLVDMLADYLALIQQKEDNSQPVLPWQSPRDLMERWQTPFSKQPDADFHFETFCQSVIKDSLHLHHPKYMGHQVVPPAPMASLVDFLSDFLNNSMAIYEVGPASSVIEKCVMDWLASTIGMDNNAGGILTSGGSIGNLTGLLAARQHHTSFDTWKDGVFPANVEDKDAYGHLAVMVPSESHYSVARAVQIMGLGEKGIVKIPINQRFEINPHMLEQTYQEALKQGKQIFAVVANACSTSTGSYDPLEPIAEFCEKHHLWFHVDGAHGGGAILTEKYRHLVNGLERADSIVIDFHKMLLCPALTTAVIFKNGTTAFETFSQKAAYLLSDKKNSQWFDVAQRTLECTKKMMSLKIYALLKLYGSQLFSNYITVTYDLARDFAALIKNEADFELAVEPASNIVCFRFRPEGMETRHLNEMNEQLRHRIKEDGEYYIVQTVIDGKLYLRTTLMNPFTTMEDLKGLLEKIRCLGGVF